ncbi:MAG: ATP-binding protein, partial [Pseudomonadota bacterium]
AGQSGESCGERTKDMPGEQPDSYTGAKSGACVNGHKSVQGSGYKPEDTSVGGKIYKVRFWRCRLALFASSILFATSMATANETGITNPDNGFLIRFAESVESNHILMLAIFGGAMSFALLSASWLIRERAKILSTNQKLKQSLADLRASNDRNEALVNTADQRIVVWNGGDDQAIILGSLPGSTGAPDDKAQFVQFGRWLDPDFSRSFENNIRELRLNAVGFETVLKSKGGGIIEVTGGTSGSYAFARFRDLKGVREEKAQIEAHYESLNSSFAKVESLLSRLPMPVWLKDQFGKLVWVNHSYAEALEIENPKDAVTGNLDLFDAEQREDIQKNLTGNELYEALVPATVAGDRKKLQVFNIGSDRGSAGIAIDKSDVEDIRRMLKETNESHSRMLDQLATAVAIFDSSQKLVFHNNGFQQLWNLDPLFLSSNPSNAEILDAMRDGKLLPEHPDWRKWREGQLQIYTAIEPIEEWWHLLDGQTIRVVSAPRSQGGSTWIFENVTERLALESNYNALMRIQGETLDHLNEAVAVFGSNGQLKLFNPALEELWGDADIDVQEGLHVTSVIDAWTASIRNGEDLEKILGQVTGFDDVREDIEGRMELDDRRSIQYSVVPLPEGQSMLTLTDVTANVNFERALKERAEALEASDLLKSKFIQHVSYELRAPLTNISGFGEMLADVDIGKLNEKQVEYLSHINESAVVLRAIVDDILDLASIDAGTMTLEYGPVNLDETVRSAFEELADGMRQKGLRAAVDISPASETVIADETRLLQVVRNLLSNAINFSPDGGEITITANQNENMHEVRIFDQGPGIDENELQAIFDRFETRAPDGTKRGTGLGLSIVRSLVELHGGTVEVERSETPGTCILCQLPVEPPEMILQPHEKTTSIADAA